MGTVIPGRWGSGRSETSARSKARGTRGGTGPPYQLKISLLEIEPEVWRWLLVPGGVRLERLHEIFQLTMGWTNSHLHEFRVGDTRYGEPDPEYDDTSLRGRERRPLDRAKIVWHRCGTMPITRERVEQEVQKCLRAHEDIRPLLRQGSFAGVCKFAQVVHSCVEKLNAEAGLTGHRAVLVTSTVLQGSLPSMLLFREGSIRAASHAVSTLWISLSTGEPAELVQLPQKILAKRQDERELEELAHMFPIAVFEETAAGRKGTDGRDVLRRLMTYLDLSFDDVGRILEVSGETVRRWERGVSRIPSEALATLQLVDSALNRLMKLFLPQRLPEVVRRKADLFDGSRALDQILQGRIAEVVDLYEQALSYQG